VAKIGPIQLLAVAYGPEAQYQGQVLDQLARLEGQCQIRVLDLLFVGQDIENNELVALDYQGDELGALVGALLGFPFERSATELVLVGPAAEGEAVGYTRSKLQELIGRTPPDYAIALLLVEHVWARDLKQAMVEAGGVPLGEGFLAPDALSEIAVELGETIRLIEELEGEERSARLTT
jgi:hypothetical protein